jgi:sulfopyruvate decarboxylase alpha subunit
VTADPEHGWGKHAHEALTAANIRQVAYVPDAGLSELLALCASDQSMRTILLAHEQEGAGIVAGAWLGGVRAAFLMQSSGVGNCMNALSLIKTCRFPFLAIVTMRGEWREANPWQLPMGQGAAAHLEQCGVIVSRVDDRSEAYEKIGAAAALAFENQAATAVLIGQRVIGAKSFDK